MKLGMEFGTQEALDEYLKEHPDADKSKHSVKEKKEKKDPTEVQEKPSLGKFLSSIKGMTRAMGDSLRKAPEELQKFVSDPEERQKVLSSMGAKLKSAPKEIGKDLLRAAKEHVQEYKTAGGGYLKGDER